MCYAEFERTVASLSHALHCPARRAVYLSEREARKKVEFVDHKFLSDLGSVSHSPGVLVDGDLYVIHFITHIDTRNPRKRQPYATLHLMRSSQAAISGHYYFIAPPGYRKRLLKIPSEDIMAVYFPASEQREELTANMPWEYATPHCPFPFEKYEMPLVESLLN